MHLRPSPRPSERVRVQLIVLSPAVVQVLDEVDATGPITSLQVPLAEGSEKEFGLIEPRGVRGGLQHSDLGVVFEKGVSIVRDVTGASVPDEVNALCTAVNSEELLERRLQVLAVVRLETLTDKALGSG